MNYLFTSESVSEGHPDKVADQISDAILDEFLRQDPESKVACETFCSTGMVVVMGEVKSEAYVDIQTTVRNTINRIGYNKAEYMFDGNSCGVMSALHEQSADINRGVERAEADDQDGDTHKPVKVDTIVLSTQHDEFVPESLGRMSYADAVKQYGQAKVDAEMQAKIRFDVETILIPRLKEALPAETAGLIHDYTLHVNPTGKFVIGGPHGDTGLTGRKIIVDTYGGKGAHGGGAFSGKDPSKVDRSAAYAARYIAKNLVAAGVADECLVQLAYAIGVARPVSVFVDTYGTAKNGLQDGEIAKKINEIFDLRPAKIIKKFGLKNPIYAPTAAYGHMGRAPERRAVTVQGKRKIVQFFGWELLDSVPRVKEVFGLE